MDNPEFRRHAWLELTPHRLVVMPGVLALAFVFVHVLTSAAGGDGAAAAARAAVWTFGGLLLLWGTRLAADSVTEEVRARTWDQQRMSALPPWQMAWGKLLGGPIYPWYGALLCAAAALLLGRGELVFRAAELVLLAVLAVLLHGAVLVFALLAVRRGGELSSRSNSLIPLLVLFVAVPLLQTALGEAGRAQESQWYGVHATFFTTSLVSTLLFAGWAVMGVHRLMRAELQVRGTPAAWLAFLLFCMGWAAGFVPRELGSSPADTAFTPTRLLVAYAIAHAATYSLALSERKEPAVFRRLLWFRRHGQRDRFLDELPLWLVSLLVAWGAAAALLLQPVSAVSGSQKQLVAALVLLGIRDLALFLVLSFADRGQLARGRSSETAAVVYLVVLYGLAPGILRSLELEGLRGLFWPRLDVGPAAALLPLALEAAAVAALAGLRWRRAVQSWPREAGGDPAPSERGPNTVP